ncbi:MAG: tetratricopeptide repeat protein [bacterium]|nr:tetratricopeptide repeat protein [bacterium]
MRIINILLLLILVLLVSLVSGCADQAKEYYQRGLEYSRSDRPEDWQRAIAEFKKIIELKVMAYDRTAHLYRKLGDHLLSRGFWDEAVKYYRQALELQPGIADLHYSLGICYANKGVIEEKYFDEAIKEYQIAIRLDPEFAEPHYGLGMIYFFKKEEHERGISYFKEAIRLKPKYVDAHLALAKAYYQLKRYADALTRYDYVIKLYPSRMQIVADYHYNKGIIYKEMGQDHQAIESLQKAIDTNYHHVKAREELKELGVSRYDRLGGIKEEYRKGVDR